MNHIEALLRRLAPDGVESRSLGEIGQLVRGHSMPKTDFVESGIGAIHYGQIYTYYDTWTATTLSHVAPTTATRLAKVDPGDVIITNTSENLDDVGKAVAWLGDHQIVTGGHATVFKHQQDPKFISYWFQTPHFYNQKKRLATGTKVIDVSASNLAKVRIPLPPLEIQRTIVEVLDTFRSLEAELAAELEAELEARRRQYRHYRDALLTFHERERVRRAPMSELGTFRRGRRFTKADLVAVGIPSIHYGEIYTDYGVAAQVARCHVRTDLHAALRYAHEGDVIIAGVGETVEDVGKAVAWLGAEPIAYHDDCFAFTHAMNPKFVSYAMQTQDFHGQKGKFVSRAKVKRLSAEGLGKIMIPAPERKKQDRIVEVLDSFDALVIDLSIGLPAELAARRTQYEHYRDKLLTFPEAS